MLVWDVVNGTCAEVAHGTKMNWVAWGGGGLVVADVGR